jgi:NAD(P)-dependent dehydrogenase (short-subunit alcohol dehydrogenase family)
VTWGVTKMDLGLHDKVAVITGGSVGIGLAVAKCLAAEGAHVAIAARNAQRLDTARLEIADFSKARVVAVSCNVATPEGVAELLRVVEREFGGGDILVNNAGSGSNETIMDADDEKWQSYWDLHVMAAVRLARGLVPSMRRRGGGVILNNASICASQPLWYEPIYNVTKAALVMLSKTMANEFIKDGIRVNAINPGFVLTPDWIKTAKQLTADKGGDWQGYIDALAKDNAPIGRFASPEEIADFFVFLCSSRSSYSVGSTYFVDGGMLKTI